MQLPNKLYSYQESNLARIPVVLGELQAKGMRVEDLYRKVRSELAEPTDFMGVMDCLYALGAIDMNDEGEVFLCL